MRFLVRAYVVTVAMLFVGMVLSAQTVKESDILTAKKNGMSDAQIVKLIQVVKKVDVDTSFGNLQSLKEKGITDEVIQALSDRKEQLEGKKPGVAKKISIAETSESIETPAPAKPSGVSAASSNACPSEQGVYFHSGSSWVEVEPISPQMGGKQGIMKVGLVYTFPGSDAPLKIQISNPEFCIRDIDVNLRDISLAVLKKNRKTRDVEISSVGNLGHSGRSEKNFRPVQASKIPDGAVLIKLTGLEDGEFALAVRGGTPQYDFSVRTK